MSDITEKQKQVIEKVRKLLALSQNNTNEHEAQSAAQLAMDLLSSYNLSMHQVGASNEDRTRKDNRLKGGLYQWQRGLWEAVANLNFCMYIPIKGTGRGQRYEHRIVGSNVNVISTEVMGDYLQQAIERLARQYAKEQGMHSIFCKDAIAYREGMALRIMARLSAERRERTKRDEESRGDGTALVLADVANTEHDLNRDHFYGYEPGTHAARRAEAAARQAKYTAEYEERMRAHEERLRTDEEYAKQYKEQQAREKAEADERRAKSDAAEKRRMRNANKPGYDSMGYKIQYRSMTAQEKRASSTAFVAGYHDGANVSLNKQVDEDTRKGIK